MIRRLLLEVVIVERNIIRGEILMLDEKTLCREKGLQGFKVCTELEDTDILLDTDNIEDFF